MRLSLIFARSNWSKKKEYSKEIALKFRLQFRSNLRELCNYYLMLFLAKLFKILFLNSLKYKEYYNIPEIRITIKINCIFMR